MNQISKPGNLIGKQLRNVSGILEQRYMELVEQNKIEKDHAQIKALHSLQHLLNTLLLDHQEQQSGFFKKFKKNPRQSKNLYIYGEVGQGKSMLMDLFYDNCLIQKKRRVHFHTFMLEVHEFAHTQRSNRKSDYIIDLAHKLHDQTRLLCFDEFHVIDVANAVILDRLFRKLFELGTIVVTTSNRHPDDLYQGGVTPEMFLNFIALLKKTSDVIELSGKKDYRLAHTPIPDMSYYTPLTNETTKLLKRKYLLLTNSHAFAPKTIRVLGRDIHLISAHGEIAFSSFKDLCQSSLGPADYLELTQRFNILFLIDIPKLGADQHDEAKRFSTLIDALYFHRIHLICSAEVPALELYDKENSGFYLKRTVSRLIEMQSANYAKKIFDLLPDQ